MLAEKNAERADRTSAHQTDDRDGAPALQATAAQAVAALRRYLQEYTAARLDGGGADAMPDELVRAAARLLEKAGATRAADDNDALQRTVRLMTPLTQRERTVAFLVGRRLTNHEIADELHLSTKTVEYHLTNIYHKLHVRSRRELRELLNMPR